MARSLAVISRAVLDLLVLALAFLLGFLVRFDGSPPPDFLVTLFLTWPYVVLFEYAVLGAFGVHRFAWRYIGLREALQILVATAAATAGLALWRMTVGLLDDQHETLRPMLIPFGVIAVNFALVFLGTTGLRVWRRVSGERRETGKRASPNRTTIPTMLVGAGQAGVLVARELASRPDLGLRPVGFLDDDRGKHGTVIHGIPVLGSTAELPALCQKYQAKQVLISLANAPGTAIRRIRGLCDEARLPAKIIPGLYEIVGGQVNLSRIRNVAIEDLLGRQPVQLDLEGIAEQIGGRVVLTTGAGGSIGSELCRQICRFKPKSLVLVERAENNLFNIHRELSEAFPNIALIPCIADIGDVPRMTEVFGEHQPAIVLHAAAHKHVPMMEWNPNEAIKNNVLGTKNVADLASAHGVSVFVMISTDKAVNPSSVMGATKRAAEIYVQAMSQRSSTRFVTVRFGNVLGSAGSVIPIFQEQIAKGGPVTVTHPDMRRYFMTIPEACQLVLQAGSMGRGGEIFILDMGEPVKIVDLARDLIALSGLREGEDIEVKFSGVRPGEKLFEELATDSEEADKTRHPKIFVGRIAPRSYDVVCRELAGLRDVIESGSNARPFEALARLVPEYVKQATVPTLPPVAVAAARVEVALDDEPEPVPVA
jgi:FlaA1/EpsC-like NDP-sugar epimerase